MALPRLSPSRPLAVMSLALFLLAGLSVPGPRAEEKEKAKTKTKTGAVAAPPPAPAKGPPSPPAGPEADRAEAAEAALGEVGVMLVSTVSSPAVYAPVESAQKTVLAPAQVTKYGVQTFSKEAWAARGEVWTDFLAGMIQRADRLVDSIEPDFKRDSRGVIDYALVEHPSPWLTSVLLSKRFLPRFAREFGQRLHVVPVDRHRFFVFPADGGKLPGYGPALVDLYHDESICRYPVSLEVLLVDETGFRAVGMIEE